MVSDYIKDIFIRRKVLGAGGFGVVKRPNLTCPDFKKIDKKYVSKLAKKYSAWMDRETLDVVLNKELKNLAHLKKKDPKGLNFVLPVAECSVKKLRYYHNIIFPYSGVALTSKKFKKEFFKKNKTKKDIYKKIIRLISLVDALHDAGMIHFDLYHGGNVVYSPETNKLKLIDFGISSLTKDVKKNLNKYFTKYKTFWNKKYFRKSRKFRNISWEEYREDNGIWLEFGSESFYGSYEYFNFDREQDKEVRPAKLKPFLEKLEKAAYITDYLDILYNGYGIILLAEQKGIFQENEGHQFIDMFEKEMSRKRLTLDKRVERIVKNIKKTMKP